MWCLFVQQVVFLTVNHRGALPLRELHSTDKTILWRDPGGLSLFTITSEFTLPEAGTYMYGLCGASHMKQFAFPTISLCRELGMWGGEGCYPTISDYQWLSQAHGLQVSQIMNTPLATHDEHVD